MVLQNSIEGPGPALQFSRYPPSIFNVGITRHVTLILFWSTYLHYSVTLPAGVPVLKK